jgi:hypothetical protein
MRVLQQIQIAEERHHQRLRGRLMLGRVKYPERQSAITIRELELADANCTGVVLGAGYLSCKEKRADRAYEIFDKSALGLSSRRLIALFLCLHERLGI